MGMMVYSLLWGVAGFISSSLTTYINPETLLALGFNSVGFKGLRLFRFEDVYGIEKYFGII